MKAHICLFFDKKQIVVLLMIASFLIAAFQINHSKAQEGKFLGEVQPAFQPHSINDSSLPLAYPYVAGYITFTDDPDNTYIEGRASAVKVTVTFSGTNKSIIQSGNWLFSGVNAQGPHHLGGIPGFRPQIDWGYTLNLVLDPAQTDPYIKGDVWKAYEWGRHMGWPAEPPEVDHVSSWTWNMPGILTVDSEVTLIMSWGPRDLQYSARIDGALYDLYTYVPVEADELSYFMLGNVHRETWWGTPLPGTVKFLQFVAASSYYNIGEVGWLSIITDPYFVMTNETEWKPASIVFVVQGPDSFFDQTMTWGWSNYDDVGATYSFQSVRFYPEDGTTLETNTLLWADYPPYDPLPPSGRNIGYAGMSYEYSAVTWDPDIGDEVRYEFEWDDGTRNFTDWHPSGYTALISKVWDGYQVPYHIRVRAQDSYGVNSSWSDYYSVAIYGAGDVKPTMYGNVDILDLAAVATEFGNTCPPVSIAIDVYPDGTINIVDIVQVALHFGATYSYYHGLTDLLDPPETQPLTGLSTFISVDPNQVTVCKDQTFPVNITVTNVTSLYGWEFKAYWNSTVLNLTSVQVHTPDIWGQDTFVAGAGTQNDFNETHGRYWKAMSALNPAPSLNGSITLATLTFKALNAGTTPLDLQDTKLADSEALAIDHDAFDSTVTVIPHALYMRSDQHTINNATMYKLMETHTQNGTSTRMSTTDPENEVTCYWGIRVWERSANGTEVELTSGSPVAAVSRSSSGQGLQSATWNCPATSLNPTDSLVVRVYYKFDFQSYSLSSQFTTVQLNATSLTGQTWTVYYYTSRSYNSQQHKTYVYYYWDNTYLSRIENLDYD